MKNTHVNFSTVSAGNEVVECATCRRCESDCITRFVTQSNELHMRGEGLQINFSHLGFCDVCAKQQCTGVIAHCLHQNAATAVWNKTHDLVLFVLSSAVYFKESQTLFEM